MSLIKGPILLLFLAMSARNNNRLELNIVTKNSYNLNQYLTAFTDFGEQLEKLLAEI